MMTSRRIPISRIIEGCQTSTGIIRPGDKRKGAATLDYILVLGAILPIAGVSIYLGGKIIKLVYEMTCVLVSWPFM